LRGRECGEPGSKTALEARGETRFETARAELMNDTDRF